jgi:hypothetical protein
VNSRRETNNVSPRDRRYSGWWAEAGGMTAVVFLSEHRVRVDRGVWDGLKHIPVLDDLAVVIEPKDIRLNSRFGCSTARGHSACGVPRD